jgi:hypothetical protein
MGSLGLWGGDSASLTLGEGGLERVLDLVQAGAHCGLQVRGDFLHPRHHRAELALGADVGDAPGLEGVGALGGGELGEGGGLELVQVVEHGHGLMIVRWGFGAGIADKEAPRRGAGVLGDRACVEVTYSALAPSLRSLAA